MEIYPLRNKDRKISYSPKDVNVIKSLMLFILTNPQQRIYKKTDSSYSSINNNKQIIIEQVYAYSYDFHISYKDLRPSSYLTLRISFSKFYDNITYNSVEDYIKLILVSYYSSYKDWKGKFMKPIVRNHIFPLIRKKKNMLFVVKLGSIKRFKIN